MTTFRSRDDNRRMLESLGSANADDHPAFRSRRLGRADLQLGVGHPAHDVAGIHRVQDQGPGVQVQPVDVEQGAVAEVQCDQDGVGKVGIDGRRLGLDSLERREVAHVVRGQVHSEKVEVLIAVAVLQVNQHLAVLGPEKLTDTTLGVGRDGLVVVLANRLDPDLQNISQSRQDYYAPGTF